jgi:hypothetical protein
MMKMIEKLQNQMRGIEDDQSRLKKQQEKLHGKVRKSMDKDKMVGSHSSSEINQDDLQHQINSLDQQILGIDSAFQNTRQKSFNPPSDTLIGD